MDMYQKRKMRKEKNTNKEVEENITTRNPLELKLLRNKLRHEKTCLKSTKLIKRRSTEMWVWYLKRDLRS